jgi:hypothetical protein
MAYSLSRHDAWQKRQDMTTAEDLKKHLANQGAQTLGAIVTWSLHGIRIPRKEFVEGFKLLGLSPATGRSPRPDSLARRAVTASKAGRKHVLIRELAKDETKIVWGIVGERIRSESAGAEANYTQQSRVAVNRLNGVMHLEDRDDETALAIEAAYLEARGFAATPDLSSALIRAVLGTEKHPLLGGMRLAGSGGCYWVPAAHLPELRRLAAWVESVNADSYMTLFEVTGAGANLRNAARAAQQTIRARCEEILTETRSFVAELRKGDAKAEIRAGVMKTRMTRFDRLRDQAGLYADVLGDMQATLEEEIAAARSEVLGLNDVDDFDFES